MKTNLAASLVMLILLTSCQASVKKPDATSRFTPDYAPSDFDPFQSEPVNWGIWLEHTNPETFPTFVGSNAKVYFQNKSCFKNMVTHRSTFRWDVTGTLAKLIVESTHENFDFYFKYCLKNFHTMMSGTSKYIIYYSSDPISEKQPGRYYLDRKFLIQGTERYYGGMDILSFEAAGVLTLDGKTYHLQSSLKQPTGHYETFFHSQSNIHGGVYGEINFSATPELPECTPPQVPWPQEVYLPPPECFNPRFPVEVWTLPAYRWKSLNRE